MMGRGVLGRVESPPWNDRCFIGVVLMKPKTRIAAGVLRTLCFINPYEMTMGSKLNFPPPPMSHVVVSIASTQGSNISSAFLTNKSYVFRYDRPVLMSPKT
jgi:hypothetical protein